ncbi:fibronectin type III domain-containing protein [Paenibacillus qinlingensis]|uniref:fibronectin type III domain-containing protein n=1 Tax=Paenibacillus qinlingensis TaxID=1837343 RepID=UPI001565802C|nr:fibronectin type III domain-containing protein [Paenibacillus qinlingensis]NQX62282.1 fibronectin type III domain-containing protein [Paenibacillus qinlingensis]
MFQAYKLSKVIMASTAAALLLTGGILSPQQASAANGTPNYEVKFNLNPSIVVDSSHNLISSVRSQFSTGSSSKSYRVQYMDTATGAMDAQGWSDRIRKKSSDSTHQLQFKKRYPITNGDITGALTTAANDGLNSSASGFEFQVDWTLSKQTLSVQYEKDVTVSGYSGSGLNAPNLATSRSISVSNAPSQLKNWSSSGWGTTQLNNSVIYGPIDFKRYEGTFDDFDLDIEVWTILNAAKTGTEDIVEASFKADTLSEATTARTALMNLLNSKGWLVQSDVLKTSLIMERYAPTAPTPDTTVPSVATGLTATATSSTQVQLNWTAATDNVAVTSYDVYRNGTKIGSSSTLAYSDSGLTASTAYSYTVIAKDAAGNASIASSAVSATTSAGGGTGTLYYNVNGSNVSYIEAETYTAKTGTFTQTSCTACSGSSNMQTPNGSGDSDTNYLKYDLEVTNGGSFYIYLLSQGPDGSSDSFNVAVDSGSNYQVTTGSAGSWAWKKPSSSISLSTGTHTLYIKVREDGAQVDKIALSKTSSTPSGLGGTALVPSTH